MNKLLLAIIVLCSFGGTMHSNGSLKNYQCSKCATVVKTDRSPSSLNCRAGGSHQWNKLSR